MFYSFQDYITSACQSQVQEKMRALVNRDNRFTGRSSERMHREWSTFYVYTNISEKIFRDFNGVAKCYLVACPWVFCSSCIFFFKHLLPSGFSSFRLYISRICWTKKLHVVLLSTHHFLPTWTLYSKTFWKQTIKYLQLCYFSSILVIKSFLKSRIFKSSHLLGFSMLLYFWTSL